MLKFNRILAIVISIFMPMILLVTPVFASTPTINGTIAAGEYGTHTDGFNQQTNGGTTAYVTWDATNLYIAYANAPIGEGVVVYIDTNPIVPANGGADSNGNLTGQNYDSTGFSTLPFRADFVTFFKNSYREYRTANGSGVWSGATTGFGSYADNGSNVRELAIPWSAMGGQPTSFNFFSYATSAGGFVYGQVPTGNSGGTIGTSATYSNYYLVASTSAPSYPFAADSTAGYCYATADNNVTTFNSANALAVRNAITAAAVGGTVKVAGYCAGVATDSGTTQVALITKTLTIAGGYTTTNWTTANPGVYTGTLDALGGGRVLYSTANVTVENVSLQNGYISGTQSGGGLYINGALVMSHSEVYSNVSTASGGGAYVTGAVFLTNSLIISNQGSFNVGLNQGGGINSQGFATIENTNFYSNAIINDGGGIFAVNGLSISNGLFQANRCIVGCSGGGAGTNTGNLTITGTKFISNSSGIGCGSCNGGAAFSNGNITITNAYFERNYASNRGGAVVNFGGASTTLQVINSTFMTNTAINDGGGIRQGGAAYITSSTFVNNSSSSNGGGLYLNAGGQVVNSLLAANSSNSNGAGIYASSSITLMHTTIASPTQASGVAVYIAGGTANITNTIIASHTTGIQRASGTVNENYNLFYGNSANTSGTVTSGGNSIIGNPAFYDTNSYTLTASSAAIDVGTNLNITTDYFGDVRPQQLGTDMGYAESPFAGVFACYAKVNNGATVYNSNNAQAVRDAISAASAGDTVKVAGYCAGVATQGSTNQVAYVSKVLTIAGGYTTTNWTTSYPTTQTTTLDALNDGRVVYVTNINGVTLQGFSVTNGYINAGGSTLHGGGIYANGALTLTNMTVYSNMITGTSGSQNGGGVYVGGAALVTSTTLMSNTAGSRGGGAYFNSAVTLDSVSLISNTAQGDGGGIFAVNVVTASWLTVTLNRASGAGGGMDVQQAVTITNAIFSYNRSNTDGGGGKFEHSSVLSNTTFVSNTAGTSGGGASFYSPSNASAVVVVTHATFMSNTALSGFGGGGYFHRTSELSAVTFITNSASLQGGGAYFSSSTAPVTLTNLTFMSNTALAQGGGASTSGSIFMSSSYFTSNISTGNVGGGLRVNGTLNDTGSVFYNNQATSSSSGNGGGLQVSGAARLTNTQFISNSAAKNGGGGHFGSGVTADNVQVLSNTVVTAGGGTDGGGGFYLSGSNHIANSLFQNNYIVSTFGGGIYLASGVNNKLWLTSTRFISNLARYGGGLESFTSSAITVTNSQFLSNTSLHAGGGNAGGGINHEGASALITGTLFQNNQALGSSNSNGGGVRIQAGAAFITNSQFIGNSGSNGGGVALDGAATMTVTNLLLARNTVITNNGAAIYVNTLNAIAHIMHTTIASPTVSSKQGIYITNNGTAYITNTIVASHATGIHRNGGTVYENNNLFYGNTNNFNTTTNVINGGSSFVADPLFSAPSSDDYHLQSLSPAGGAGQALGVTTDIDGDARNLSSPAIGMDEVVGPALACYTTINGSTVYSSSNAAAIWSAISAANNNDTIKVAGYCAGVAIQGGTLQTAYINKPLTLRGGYTTTDWVTPNFTNNVTTLDARGSGRVMMGTAALTVENLKLQNGVIAGTGAGINSSASLVLSNATVYSNTSSTFTSGGGVYVNNTIILTSSRFLSNTAGSGAGLYSAGNNLVTDTLGYFEGNFATGFCGGIRVGSTSASFQSTQFISNTSLGNGGAGCIDGGLTATNIQVISNTSSGSGGGFYNGGNNYVTNSQFMSNTATISGGGLLVNIGGVAYLTSTTFTNNIANGGSGQGGGAYIYGAVTLSNTTFSNNRATTHGGGLFANATLTLTNGTFSQNSSGRGGGLFVNINSVPANISNTTFTYNQASVHGGGFFLGNNVMGTVDTVSVLSNTATQLGGGAVFATSSNNVIRNSVFSNNTAGTDGGGIHTDGALQITNTTFISNAANGGLGGGVHFANGATHALTNTLFARNRANTNGAAIDVGAGVTRLSLVHVTIVSPTLATGAAVYITGTTVYLTNTIIASHTTGIQQVNGTVRENYNLFYGNGANTSGSVTSGGNSVIGDPLFADTNYHLGNGSVAINVGTNLNVTSDFEGEIRPQQTYVDMGYDESPYLSNVTDLVMGKTATLTTPVVPSQIFSYTLIFTNSGSDQAKGIFITDTLPTQLSLLGYQASGVTVTSTGSGSWQVADMGVGVSGMITLTVQMTSNIATFAWFTNSAIITTTTRDITPTNNSATSTLRVSPLMITEIMVDPSGAGVDAPWEWVELYNAGTAPINLAGMVFDDDDFAALGTANITSGSIPVGGSVVLFDASSGLTSADFQAAWGGTINLVPVTPWPDIANASGETLGLWANLAEYNNRDFSQAIEALYTRDNSFGWSWRNTFASIYLKDLTTDNNVGSNWAFSTVSGVTPLYIGYQSQANNGNSGNDVGSPGPSADLVVKKNVLPATAIRGDWLTYTIAFSNSGNYTATTITITDIIPISLTNVSYQATGATITATNGVTYSWTVADLVPSATGMITIYGQLITNVVAGTLTNTITISSKTFDVALANNQSVATMTILPIPDLALSKFVMPQIDTPYHGLVTYSLVITNNGAGDAVNTMITDTLPTEVDFDSWVIQNGANVTSDEITWNGIVSAGQVLTVSFAVSHTGNYQDIITNYVDLTGFQTLASNTTFTVATSIPPVAVTDTVTTTEEIAVLIDVVANDTDIDGNNTILSNTVAIVTMPMSGTVITNANGTITYTPSADFYGIDVFSYTVKDNSGATSNVAVVTVTVNSMNDVPIANNDNTTTNYQTAVNVNVLANDILGNNPVIGDQPITLTVGTAANGTVTLNPNLSVTYTPNAGFVGMNTFTYTITDGNSDVSNVAVVTVTVTNTPPVFGTTPQTLPDWYTTTENLTLTVTIADGVLKNDLDLEGQPLIAALLVLPANGTVSVKADGSFVYVPNRHFSGTDSFIYVANDGLLNSDLTKVTIIVIDLPNNLPVVTGSLHYTMTESTVLSVPTMTGLLSNVTDADNDLLTVTLITPPITGTLELSVTGSFVYTPPVGFTGTVTLTYEVTDGRGGIVTQTARIEVLAKPLEQVNLQVSKSVTPNGQVMPGQRVTYTIYYTNAGPSVAQGVVISDTMLGVNQLLGNLGVSQSGVLTYAIDLQGFENLAGLTGENLAGLVITNMVTISSETAELDEADNVAIVTNSVTMPRVGFDRPDYVVNESDGFAVVTLTLNVAPFMTVTVGVVSQDKTATAGQDYQAISQTLNFAPGQMVVTMTVPLIDDLLDEVTETVTLRWQNPQGALAGATNPVTLTIVDNDEVITPPLVVVYTPSITLSLSANPLLAKVGQVITYNYAVTNTGNISLSAISSHFSSLTSHFSPLISHLAVGESITGTFSYTVQAADFPDPIVATMQVTGTGGITVVTAVATATVELMRNVADLSLSKVAEPNPVMTNTVLTYTLTITNNGPDLASEVILTDALPSEVELLSHSAACAGQTVLTCTLGMLSPNMTQTFTVTVKPMVTGTLTNSARVYSPDFDPEMMNNVATATTEVGWIDLQATLTITGSHFITTNTVVRSSELTYTIWLTNFGSLTATNLVLTHTMPATMSQLLVVSGLCNQALVCQLGDLGPQSSISLTLVVRVTAEGLFTNTVQISADNLNGVISDTITVNVVKLHIYLPLLRREPPTFEVPQFNSVHPPDLTKSREME